MSDNISNSNSKRDSAAPALSATAVTSSVSSTSNSKTPSPRRNTPAKKINKIVFSEHGFSIGDIQRSRSSSPTSRSRSESPAVSTELSEASGVSGVSGVSRVSRASAKSRTTSSSLSAHIITSHWKQQSSVSDPRCKICGKTLNVKNGIVNCRKCGELYCNEHTHYQVKLRNPDPQHGETKPQFDTSAHGIWCRCCELCYMERRKTEVNFVDVTLDFKQKRQEHVDQRELHETKVQRNFIKLTNLMVDKSLLKRAKGGKKGNLEGLGKINSTSNGIFSFFKPVSNDEMSIIGADNWVPDDNATNCTICFTKFNFIIRKHHCRLCGEVVCDDSSGVRKNCSLYVPLVAFLEKLPNLNYSSQVRKHWSEIDQELRFRCCVNCKNAVLHDWKRVHRGQIGSASTIGGTDVEGEEIFRMYDGMLLQKGLIEQMMHQYEFGSRSGITKVGGTGSDGEDEMKTGHKLMLYLKEFENLVIQFKKKFFFKDNDKLLIQQEYLNFERVLLNMYQSVGTFLQNNIIKFKAIQEERRPKIEQILPEKEETPVPRLTKKQIRELREQLMVLNEQKFLIENQIQEFTRNRQFDELNTLITNKDEILDTIKQVENELGEFGF